MKSKNTFYRSSMRLEAGNWWRAWRCWRCSSVEEIVRYQACWAQWAQPWTVSVVDEALEALLGSHRISTVQIQTYWSLLINIDQCLWILRCDDVRTGNREVSPSKKSLLWDKSRCRGWHWKSCPKLRTAVAVVCSNYAHNLNLCKCGEWEVLSAVPEGLAGKLTWSLFSLSKLKLFYHYTAGWKCLLHSFVMTSFAKHLHIFRLDFLYTMPEYCSYEHTLVQHSVGINQNILKSGVSLKPQWHFS